MKYINQLDYPDVPYITRQTLEDETERERGKYTTAATSACGLCSAIMVLDRLLPNAEFTLNEAIQMSYDAKANLRIGTDYNKFVPVFAEKFGLEFEMTNDPDRMLYCLRTGGCAVALSTGDTKDRIGVFTHTAHYIVIINEERDGRLAILDPANKPGKFDEPGRKGKVEVKNNICFSDVQTLLDELSHGKDPGFCLFWRK